MDSPLVRLGMLWLGTLVGIVMSGGTAFWLHFHGLIARTPAILIGAIGSGICFVFLYYFYKRGNK